MFSVSPLLGVDRDTGGEVVDEVDALADLLAGVGVDAVLAVLGVRHRRHGDVVALGRRPVSRVSNVPFSNSNFTPSCLPIASARSGSMPTTLPESSLNSTGAYAMSEPTLMTPLSRIAAGSLLASGAELVDARCPSRCPSWSGHRSR
jgi:hypothetical protein